MQDFVTAVRRRLISAIHIKSGKPECSEPVGSDDCGSEHGGEINARETALETARGVISENAGGEGTGDGSCQGQKRD